MSTPRSVVSSLTLTPSQLTFEPERVEGWYQLEAPSRRLKGTAFVAATKSKAGGEAGGMSMFAKLGGGGGGGAAPPPWDITSLRVEFDRDAMEAADTRRAAISAAAGYRRQDEVQGAVAAAAAGDTHGGEKGDKVVIEIV